MFLFHSSIWFTLTAIKNVGKNKPVKRGSATSNRGSNDISVIVDGDRDGEITASPIDPGDTTNSQVKCTACYISTLTDVNMWIRIDLADNYFITEINIVTGEPLVHYPIMSMPLLICCIQGTLEA